MAWQDIAIVLSAPLLKNLAGWINASMKDYDYTKMGLKFWKCIQPYEVDKLIKSSVRTLMIAIPIAVGFKMPTGQEMGIAVFIDILLGQHNKAKEGKLHEK